MAQAYRQLDRKLAGIRSGACRAGEFIIADAIEADMSAAVAGPWADDAGRAAGTMK